MDTTIEDLKADEALLASLINLVFDLENQVEFLVKNHQLKTVPVGTVGSYLGLTREFSKRWHNLYNYVLNRRIQETNEQASTKLNSDLALNEPSPSLEQPRKIGYESYEDACNRGLELQTKANKQSKPLFYPDEITGELLPLVIAQEKKPYIAEKGVSLTSSVPHLNQL